MAKERHNDSEGVLDTYIDCGIRDAKNQPDVPALTLTKKGSSGLLRLVFSKVGEDFVDDIEKQAAVFSGYVVSRVGSGRTVGYRVFADERLGDEGFHLFIKPVENGRNLSIAMGTQHPDEQLIETMRTAWSQLSHIYGSGFIDPVMDRVSKHCEDCPACRKIEREVVKFY